MTFADYLDRGYLPDLQGMPETDIIAGVLSALEPAFHIAREVWGTHCSGRRVRIDAILRPKEPAGWHSASPTFGVEFKSERFGPEGMAQCADYSHTDWDGYGPLAVFLCPAVASRWAWKIGGNTAARVMQRMLGQLGVGELDWVNMQNRSWWRMERSGARIWDSIAGPGRGTVSSLATKVGHRG